MAGDQLQMVRGLASRVSPLAGDLLHADSRTVESALRATGGYTPGKIRIPAWRYFDPQFAALEKERLWSKTWQFAMREEDIPEVGDRAPYDVGDLSFMIVRTGPSEFRAFRNSCLHRGTRLCDGGGSGSSIRCPFHAWEWNLDGSLRNIPSRWDFPHVSAQEYRLPQVQVGTWAGYIFINPDCAAPPLAEALGVLPAHFDPWELRDRYTAVRVQKLVRANWKVTMEAFLEAYHVLETHSDSLGFTGDASTQYDLWDDGRSHVSRQITPSAVPSPHLGDEASSQEAANSAFQAFAMLTPGAPIPQFDARSKLSARSQVAEWRRQTMGAALNRDLSSLSDAAMIDSIQYYMFPNFFPWYGEGLPLVYQFLPYGSDPQQSMIDVRLTAPVPGGGAPRPPSAPIKKLGFDDSFSAAPEMGLLSIVFDQDLANLPRIQAGLRAAAPERAYITLGAYQEARIAHFHEVLGRMLGQ